MDANGVIFSYQVEIFTAMGILLDSTRSVDLNAMFDNLSPYTNYSVEVRALTGPMSEEILGNEAVIGFTTEIGSEYAKTSNTPCLMCYVYSMLCRAGLRKGRR